MISKSQEVSPFPSGDHKATMNRRESMANTDINNTNETQKKYRLGTVSSNLHTVRKPNHRSSELRKSLVEPEWAQAKPSIRHQLTNYLLISKQLPNSKGHL